MPTEITVERGPSHLTVTQSWSRPVRWFLLPMSLFWNGIVLAFLLVGFQLFILFHAVIGIALLYYTVLLFVNKSVLRASSRELSVEHGPLPSLSKNRKLAVRNIAQLFLKRTGSQQKGKGRRNTPLYGLAAKMDTGVEVTLINGFEDPERVRELERTIEDYLGIADAAVPVDDTLDLQPLKDLLPRRWAEKVTQLETRARGELEAERNPSPGGSSLPPLPRPEFSGTQPLPVHDVHGHFPLYRAEAGSRLRYLGEPVELLSATQTDWSGGRVTTARQLRLRRTGSGKIFLLYTEYDGSRWQYQEERRLAEEEVRKLGFTGQDHLLSFSNGDDKFYPREEQTGRRYHPEAGVQEVEQFLYFTVRSKTQFRALRPAGGDWEIYVQEAVDSGAFDAL